MGSLRYGYVADLICCMLISLVLGATLCSFSRDLFLKEIPGGNLIELEFEYLKHDGQLIVSYYDQDLLLVNSDNISVDAVKKKMIYQTDIPFIHSHRVTFSFGTNDNLVAISRLVINGEEIDLKDIAHVFKVSSGMGAVYSGEYGALIIHNQYAENELEFAPDFNRVIHLTRSELSDLKRTEIVVNLIYLCLCWGVSFLIMYYFMHVCMHRHTMYFYYGLVFFVTILAFDMSFLKATESYILNLNGRDVTGNMVKFQQSYIPLLFIGILIPLILSCQVKKLWMSVLILLVPVSLIIVLFLDSFVISNIDSRFMFMRVDRSDFFQHYQYFWPFFLKYARSPEGLFMFAGIVLFIVSCVISFRRLAMKDHMTLAVAGVAGIILVGFGLYPVKYSYNDHKFSNVFQINNFTTNKLGNYQRSYSGTYAPRTQLDFKYEIREGRNERKNVIVLFVSSLDCSLTFVCGLDDNFMPNLERIAGENLVFDNYYSNNFNLLGAYLTVVKGFPYFPPHSANEINPFAAELYRRKDMLDNFKKNGYATSFFTSAEPVFGLDKAVSAGKYDRVYTDSSPEFAEISRRYIYNSVPDGVLFNMVAAKAAEEKMPYLFVVRTSSTHSPYSTPWGDFNFEQAFRYTDTQIGIFVQSLESQGFFEDGVLIITGDHKSVDNPRIAENHAGVMVQNKVPLILVSGEHSGTTNHTFFSHSSLGILLQSMMLPDYEINKFQADPLRSSDPEVIFHYEFERKNFTIVKIGEKEAEIKLLGDDTVFQEHTFPAELENDILGYLSWIRL
jgi:phosphoglycerol transferase MdoB-like AlkP superfamily enzyme